MDSGYHCPFVGLKQNRSIRFASPTAEHRCYVTGDPQEIPVDQTLYCLSSNHVNCPLYTGEALPSMETLAPVAVAVPATGIRGWFQGLSQRDRQIYSGLVGLLAIIIIGYIVSAIFLFVQNDPVIVTQATATATMEPASASATITGTATPDATITAIVAATQTYIARPSESPAPTASATPSPRRTATPSRTAVIVVPPVSTTTLPFPSNTAAPTDTLPQPSNTAAPTDTLPQPSNTAAPTDTVPQPSNTAAPTDTVPQPSNTAAPTDSVPQPSNTPLPTITPETVVPTDEPIIPTVVPTLPSLPTELPLPTPEARTEQPAARPVEQLTLYFSDPSGRVLVPVTRRIQPSVYPRTATLEALIAGPNGELARLMPPNTRILGVSEQNGLLTVNFNQLPTYGDTSYTDAGLRSILLALTEDGQVVQVQLQVNGSNIGAPRYRPHVNGHNPQQLDGQFDTTSFLPLYFPLRGSSYYVRMMRLVPSTPALAQATVEQLLIGPAPYTDVLAQPFPVDTRVQRVAISNGLAEIDFNAAFLDTTQRTQAIEALTLALTSFASVDRVSVSVDGRNLAEYWGAAYRGPFKRPALNTE